MRKLGECDRLTISIDDSILKKADVFRSESSQRSAFIVRRLRKLSRRNPVKQVR